MTAEDDPSGQTMAEAAHAAGAVEPAVSLPNYDVNVHFVVRGEVDQANYVALQFATELAARSDIAYPIDYTISERA